MSEDQHDDQSAPQGTPPRPPQSMIDTAADVHRRGGYTALWFNLAGGVWHLAVSLDKDVITQNLLSAETGPAMGDIVYTRSQVLTLVEDREGVRALSTAADAPPLLCELCHMAPVAIGDSGTWWCRQCYRQATGDWPPTPVEKESAP